MLLFYNQFFFELIIASYPSKSSILTLFYPKIFLPSIRNIKEPVAHSKHCIVTWIFSAELPTVHDQNLCYIKLWKF